MTANRITHIIKLPKPQQEEALWYAIYTMYKSEKQVALHLKRKNIEVYIPIVSKTKRYQRKIKTYQIPLINCYVFVKILKSEQVKVLETEHVLKFIKQGKELNSIPQHEMDILKRFEGIDLEISSSPLSFNIGDEVEISHGSLVGMRGKLVRQAGKKQFVIELESIGVSLQINIETNMLRKIKNTKVVTA
jgi:transcription antitermination factor NusG